MTGASEFLALARDFQKASIGAAKALFDAFDEGGQAFAKDWQSNARATSGEHGKHYPDSITSETRLALGIEIETGPETGRKQGRMGRGFEFGSVNQPPHLDGQLAMPLAEQRIDRLSDAAIGFLIP